MKYSKERREAVLKKMLPPESRSVAEISEAEGISPGTLYSWRKEARAEGRLFPDLDSTPEGWTSADKFAAPPYTLIHEKESVSVMLAERAAWYLSFQAHRVF